jgi:ketosteroid isomerase-like protein
MANTLAKLLVAAVLILTPIPFHAQSSGQGLPATDELFKTIASLDKKLFDAYNSCDLDTVAALTADDLEFYHDQTGLAVGRQSLIDGLRNNICGKVHRDLVPGSIEVYPLKGYGAVEIGIHRFSHPGDPGPGGEAKFVTVWRLKDGKWQIARVLSFDHR